MDQNAVAKAFVEHYYSTFDTNCVDLANLYQDDSTLTFEGEQFTGAESIAAKLASEPFQHCRHSVTTVNCQPSFPLDGGGMLVSVVGSLLLAGEQNARNFTQLFILMRTPQGSFYVQNDIFRSM